MNGLRMRYEVTFRRKKERVDVKEGTERRVESALERWTKRTMERRVYRAHRSKPETKPPKRAIRTFKIAVLVEDLAAQRAEVPACSVGAVTCEEAGHHPASVDVHNLQEVGHSRAQVRVVDQAVASSVGGAVLVLGAGVALHQDGAETLGQGLAGQLDDGWLNSGDPSGLAPAQDHSSRQL